MASAMQHTRSNIYGEPSTIFHSIKRLGSRKNVLKLHYSCLLTSQAMHILHAN